MTIGLNLSKIPWQHVTTVRRGEEGGGRPIFMNY